MVGEYLGSSLVPKLPVCRLHEDEDIEKLMLELVWYSRALFCVCQGRSWDFEVWLCGAPLVQAVAELVLIDYKYCLLACHSSLRKVLRHDFLVHSTITTLLPMLCNLRNDQWHRQIPLSM